MSDRLEPPKRYDRRISEPEAAAVEQTVKSEKKSFLPKSDILTLGGIDIPFFAIVIGLLTIGLVMLFSATYPYAYSKWGDSYYYSKRQLLFMIIGIIGMLIVSKINYQYLKKYVYPLLGVTLALLVIVLFYHTNF